MRSRYDSSLVSISGSEISFHFLSYHCAMILMEVGS